MHGTLKVSMFAGLAAAVAVLPAATLFAQNPPPPDHPAVTVKGQTYTATFALNDISGVVLNRRLTIRGT